MAAGADGKPRDNDILHLAVAQSPAGLTGSSARLDWLEHQLQTHAKAKFDLLVLPELFACGYNIGDAVKRVAEPADGPIAMQIAALARRYNLAIHYGFAERDGDKLYNAAQAVGPDGAQLGRHRKLILPPGFESSYFSTGHQIDLFVYCGLTIATLICYDAEFPELARKAAMRGADIIVVPTALGHQWGWVAHQMIPTRGFENGVFLAYANHAGMENGLSYLGASFIAAPDGALMVRAGAAPDIIAAPIEKSRVQAAQARLPYHQDVGKIQLDDITKAPAGDG
jgi:predicted amidohydrolase